MPRPNVHTTPGSISNITVSSPSGTCSGSTIVTSVVTDGAHNSFVFEGTAHFAGNPNSCPVKLKAKSNGSSDAKPKKKSKDDDSTTPDPGAVTVTLSSDPTAPQTVPVNYVS